MSDFVKLDKLLKSQLRAVSAELGESVDAFARALSCYENLIVVVSDFVSDSSRIYSGDFASVIGLDDYVSENSIWEKRILDLMPEAVRREKYRGELNFFNAVSRMPVAVRRHYYLASHLRFALENGTEMDVLHKMFYVYDAESQSIRYAVCTYGPMSMVSLNGCVMVNSVTGVTEDLSPTSDDSILSRRELQVLKMIAAGHTSEEIASLLSISRHTVNRHRQEINAKLQSSNSHHAVNTAKLLGLI